MNSFEAQNDINLTHDPIKQFEQDYWDALQSWGGEKPPIEWYSYIKAMLSNGKLPSANQFAKYTGEYSVNSVDFLYTIKSLAEKNQIAFKELSDNGEVMVDNLIKDVLGRVVHTLN